MIEIQNLVVKNFKNIELADLTLSPFNVIVGPNGSGKSNLLLVISFLKFVLKGSSDEVETYFKEDYHFHFGDIFFPNEGDIEITVILRSAKTDVLYSYTLVLGRARSAKRETTVIKREVFTLKKRTSTGVPTTIFDRSGKNLSFHKTLKRTIPLASVADGISGFRALTLFQDAIEVKYRNAIVALNKVLDTQTFYFSPHVLRNDGQTRGHFDPRLTEFHLSDAIIDLNDSPRWGEFVHAVRTIANLTDIEVSTYDGRDGKDTKFVMFRTFDKINLLNELSDGMILLIALILKVMTFNNCVIFLEEPENSIHPKALQNLIHFIRQNCENKQFLITTHSSTLVNLVQPEEVFVAHLDERGRSTISAVRNVKELKNKLNKGFISFGDLLFEALDEEQEFEDIF